MERDSANLFVLEGVIIALLMLGAAYVVTSTSESSLEGGRPRTELQRLTRDILVVLDGLTDGNGTSLLDRYVAEAYHCAYDASPSVIDCDGKRSRNLSVKIENYLPLGAGYALHVSNGIESREVYRSPLPEGESVSASIGLPPEWNTSFVFTEFSCYDPTTTVNLTIVPIDRGALAWTRYGNVTVGATETPGVSAHTARWWNATLPAGRPAAGTVLANVTGNASFPGATSYTACDLAGLGPALRTALGQVTLAASPGIVPLAGSTTFTAGLGPVSGVSGVTITNAEVTIYEPISPRNTTPDTWLRAGSVVLAGGDSRSSTWTAPADTFYASHPALLRVSLTVGATSVELRKATLVQVALPTGEVPIDPPYRVSLETWMADWG